MTSFVLIWVSLVGTAVYRELGTQLWFIWVASWFLAWALWGATFVAFTLLEVVF